MSVLNTKVLKMKSLKQKKSALKPNSQKGIGSPMQISHANFNLGESIFPSIKDAQDFANYFEQLNGSKTGDFA